MAFSDALELLERLDKKYTDKSQNEANTRFKIIDEILENVFFWSKKYTFLEEHNNEGYTDYQLKDINDTTWLVIEAKREKVNFNFSQYQEVSNNKIKVKVLLKDPAVKTIIDQVRSYCIDVGCRFACITNGHEWGFFQAYVDGASWQDKDMFLILNLKDFIENFTYINKYINYNSIVKNLSLEELFDGNGYSTNERYEPKNKIHGYKEHISNNYLEGKLRGYFDRYFGEIRQADKELLEKCYVIERGYEVSFDKVSSLLEDALSPYMEHELKLKDIKIKDESRNTFSDEILHTVVSEKKSKVLILFGGKGAGKTTFLINLFNSKENTHIQDHAIIGYVNLLNVANDKKAIKDNIYEQVIDKIDLDRLLEGSNDELENLFSDRFEVELKQSLDGLDRKGETYKLKRNEILKSYKEDTLYCLSRLSNYWRGKHKAIIINIDNTDQFDQELQEYCFSLAKELSTKLQCVSIISLREERYITSNIRGYLDAYEQNGFHISSPQPQKVFLKRLEFIKEKIQEDKKILGKSLEEISIFFDVLINNLRNEKSEFNRFMTAATHGNIRHGLELFKNFVFSKYTQVDEMIKVPSWNITIHQTLKPIMIPTYRFFNETTTNTIPNIYRLRSDKRSSHFTGYRILNMLALRSDEFVSIHELESIFIEKFKMQEDFILHIDVFLKRGLIESENGLDEYSESIQRIKITPFGYYMQDTIFKDFTYLELIVSDISVLDQKTFNEVIEYSNQDYKLQQQTTANMPQVQQNALRYKRLTVRLKKVEILLEYLGKQEEFEKTYFKLPNSDITKKINDSFVNQKPRILKSAQKTLGIILKQKSKTKQGIPILDK